MTSTVTRVAHHAVGEVQLNLHNLHYTESKLGRLSSQALSGDTCAVSKKGTCKHRPWDPVLSGDCLKEHLPQR